MTTILMLFTLYVLASPAVEEPLHGYINEQGEQATPITYATIPPSYDQIKPQQTALQGSVSDEKHRYGIKYYLDSKGFIKRSTSPCAYGILNKGDRVLAINGYPFTVSYWKWMEPNTTYDLTVKHPGTGGSTEHLKYLCISEREYEQNR